MLESSVIEGTSIVTATYDGAVSSEDMSAVRERLDQVVQEHGNAKLLVELADIDWGRIEPKAAWEDVKSFGMLGDIDRCAVVTDEGWLANLVRGVGALSSPEFKTFARDERDDAVVWLTG